MKVWQMDVETKASLVQDLWAQVENVVVGFLQGNTDGSLTVGAVTLSNVHLTVTPALAREAFRRVKEELGDQIIRLNSEPSVILEQFARSLLRHSADVKREYAAGTLQVGGEPIVSQRLLTEGLYDLEADIAGSAEQVTRYFEDSLRTEITFQRALASGQTAEARKLLEALKITLQDSDRYCLQLQNWEMILAAYEGNVAAFFSAFSQCPENVFTDMAALTDHLNVLAATGLIKELQVASRRALGAQEREDIYDIFWRAMKGELAGQVQVQIPDNPEEFEDMVRKACRAGLNTLRLYPTELDVRVVWYEAD